MKISQDIRDAARGQNAVEGEGAEAGMAEMARKFKDLGGEIDVAVKG